jgi:hypothetical protein
MFAITIIKQKGQDDQTGDQNEVKNSRIHTIIIEELFDIINNFATGFQFEITLNDKSKIIMDPISIVNIFDKSQYETHIKPTLDNMTTKQFLSLTFNIYKQLFPTIFIAIQQLDSRIVPMYEKIISEVEEDEEGIFIPSLDSQYIFKNNSNTAQYANLMTYDKSKDILTIFVSEEKVINLINGLKSLFSVKISGKIKIKSNNNEIQIHGIKKFKGISIDVSKNFDKKISKSIDKTYINEIKDYLKNSNYNIGKALVKGFEKVGTMEMIDDLNMLILSMKDGSKDENQIKHGILNTVLLIMMQSVLTNEEIAKVSKVGISEIAIKQK